MNSSDSDQQHEHLRSQLLLSREAARGLGSFSAESVNALLRKLASKLESATDQLLAANQLDLDRMDQDDPRYDRLLLNAERIAAIAQDLRNVAALPTPVGEVLE